MVWEFDPGDGALVRQGLSGPGLCAVGRTRLEARQTLIAVEVEQ